MPLVLTEEQRHLVRKPLGTRTDRGDRSRFDARYVLIRTDALRLAAQAEPYPRARRQATRYLAETS